MRLHVDVEMTYALGPSQTAMLAIEAARCPGQEIRQELLTIGYSNVHRIPGESGVGTRMWTHVDAPQMQLRYQADITVTRPNAPLEGLREMPVHELPADALTYMRPSRFCQSDEFLGFVGRRFGHLMGGEKVAAICDWVHKEITYLEASSETDTTVLDTFARREGVCRDFAHMVCALVRAGNIPARYAAVYGVGVTPPDFHAVAQVWLNNDWHLVDATGMSTPDAMAVIGVGRDACDAPFMETMDATSLIKQTICVEESDGRLSQATQNA